MKPLDGLTEGFAHVPAATPVPEFARVAEEPIDDLLVAARNAPVYLHSVTHEHRREWEPEEALFVAALLPVLPREFIVGRPVAHPQLGPVWLPLAVQRWDPSEAAAWRKAGIDKLLGEYVDATALVIPYCPLRLGPA